MDFDKKSEAFKNIQCCIFLQSTFENQFHQRSMIFGTRIMLIFKRRFCFFDLLEFLTKTSFILKILFWAITGYRAKHRAKKERKNSQSLVFLSFCLCNTASILIAKYKKLF
ncbi:MAG: hypothetical protein EAZ31_09975 [Cytophagia bacterium]|nr:MAG: hypothetical protein EAZ31_09975 [Cytophagia bacterium]